MKKYLNKKFYISFSFLVLLLSLTAIFLSDKKVNVQNTDNKGYYSFATLGNESIIYMSDLDYITDNNWSYNGWSGHDIQKDKNPEGNTISLIVDGKKKIFLKGMGVHANGQVTYDVSEFSATYSKFVACVGVDASREANGSVKFNFLVSNDGTNWDSLQTTDILKGNNESVKISINIKDYKYFRVFVDKSINGNAADHGVIASAKFVKDDYVDEEIDYTNLKELSYYDDILNAYDVDYNLENNYELILKRELVRKFGYEKVQALVNYSEVYKEFFDFLLSDTTRMEEVIEVGEVNSIPFIQTLTDLYENNKNILTGENADTYQRMMIGLAAAYSTDKVASALQFSHKNADYNYLERFNIYKDLYDTGKMTIYAPYFKNYHVELMRMLMSDGARNDEIKWLNYYTRKNDNNQSVYAYVNHTGTGVGYNDDKFHNVAYKDLQDEKYKLSEYGVPFGDNIQRYWMVIDKGGICWNQSRVFQSLFNSIGSPTIGVYQPGHEAVYYYLANPDGTGKWNIANKIFSWGSTGTTWYGGNRYRTIFDWANKSFTHQMINSNSAGNSAGYVYLAQDNLNNYDKFKKSFYINLIANSYSSTSKKIETYNKAISVMNINLDSYDYLIKTYKEIGASESDWYALALKIIDNFTYYPMAMDDMLAVIKPYLENELGIDIAVSETTALKKATNATHAEVSHDTAAQEIAKTLLNADDGVVATFSFDGEYKNKIVFNDKYKNYDLAWHYSLDGGITKSKSITAKKYELTKAEVNLINESDNIQIYIDGLDVNTPTYTIDIVKRKVPSDLYNNDLENKIMGVTDDLEWRFSANDSWTSYKIIPDLTGNKTVQVRAGASKNGLASDTISFAFTENKINRKKQYVPISYLSVYDVSTEATANQGSAKNAIDGNYNTRWHSAWNGTDEERFITIELSKAIHLSQVEYVPAGGGNGKIIDGIIEGSIDGVNWFNLAEVKNLTYVGNVNAYEHGKLNTKLIETDPTKEVKFVKITATKASNGNWFTARMFNFYQDATLSASPSAGINYSKTEATNGNVVATLVDYDEHSVRILGDGLNTYTFTQNGEHEFIIMDTFTGNKSSIIAKVDWIDKTAPIGTISYNISNKTNKTVIATLKVNEEISIVKNGKLSTNADDFKYEFVENGEYTFEFVDKAGNKGTSTAKVTWIDKASPKATLNYNITGKTNKDVTVQIKFDKTNVKVLNNNGKTSYTFTKNGEFTFEYIDEAGNHGSITARVDWISKSTSTDTANSTQTTIVTTTTTASKTTTKTTNNTTRAPETTAKEETSKKSNTKFKNVSLIIIIVILFLILIFILKKKSNKQNN